MTAKQIKLRADDDGRLVLTIHGNTARPGNPEVEAMLLAAHATGETLSIEGVDFHVVSLDTEAMPDRLIVFVSLAKESP